MSLSKTPSGVFARRSFLVEAPAPAKSVRCAWRNFPSVAELIRLSTTGTMWVQKVDCLCLAANEIQACKHELCVLLSLLVSFHKK
jgi:hypothetical protein